MVAYVQPTLRTRDVRDGSDQDRRLRYGLCQTIATVRRNHRVVDLESGALLTEARRPGLPDGNGGGNALHDPAEWQLV
jgi:hypothetical protein